MMMSAPPPLPPSRSELALLLISFQVTKDQQTWRAEYKGDGAAPPPAAAKPSAPKSVSAASKGGVSELYLYEYI